jgi:hypothetical protein
MPSARIGSINVPLDTMPRDGYGLVSQGLATLVRVAQGPDAKLAMAAALALIDFGEKLLAQKASRQPEPVKVFQQSRSELLQELKGLYAKALGPGTLVVEAEAAESVPAAGNRS